MNKQLNSRLGDELGRKLYEKEARNWPVPIGWDNLGESAQYLWTERALKKHGLVMERPKTRYQEQMQKALEEPLDKPLVKEIATGPT